MNTTQDCSFLFHATVLFAVLRISTQIEMKWVTNMFTNCQYYQQTSLEASDQNKFHRATTGTQNWTRKREFQ